MKPRFWILLLLAGGLIAYSSLGDDTESLSSEELIQRDVAEKLAGWTDRRDRDCRRRALEAALLRADSLMLDYAREQKLMLDRPGRPERPLEPELRRPSDTLVLRPFLSDTM